jgi:hypothetical protein
MRAKSNMTNASAHCIAPLPRTIDTRGYQLVSVPRLSMVCNPFVEPPWEEVAGLTVVGVRQAMNDGFHELQPYSAGTRSKHWTVEDHIARIAYLAITGWTDPIEVDVGIPHMNCWVDWPVTDGNHRLAAAIARGDEFILASVAGCCSYMREVLGRFSRSPGLPSHAYRWQA